MYWGSWQPSVKPNTRPWSSARKGWFSLSRLVEGFKYLGVLFASEGKIEHEIDRWLKAASAVMQSMYRPSMLNKERSQKAKFSIYWSIHAPTFTYGLELWAVTERTRSQIQAAKISFLHRVARCYLRLRVRSSGTQEELSIKPLLLPIDKSQLRWLRQMFQIPLGMLL